MEPLDIKAMNAEIADLMDKRLRIRRGKTLEAKLKRAGRLIPKARRKDGALLVDAESKMAHPKLMKMVDVSGVKAAHDRLRAHLRAIDYWDRLKGQALGILAPIVFNLILLAAIVLGVLYAFGNP